MPVTKQTYVASASPSAWTATQLATIFRSAFIDAGLMTDWFDSFSNSGIEHRIVQVVNVSGQTYGTVYYWFMFTTTGVFHSFALQWDAVNHVPTGTAGQHFWQSSVNITTYSLQLITLTNTTDVSLIRYTSQVNSNCSWFLIRNGTSNFNFIVPFGTYNTPASGFLDQTKFAFNGFHSAVASNGGVGSSNAIIRFQSGITLKRTQYGGFLGTFSGTSAAFKEVVFTSSTGVLGGNASSGQQYLNANGGGAFSGTNWLPSALASVNTGLASDYIPLSTNIEVSNYLPALPADFAVAGHYASSSMAVQDTFVINPGVSEWEIITLLTSTTAKVMFLARII
jgi:hypothetical protein